MIRKERLKAVEELKGKLGLRDWAQQWCQKVKTYNFLKQIVRKFAEKLAWSKLQAAKKSLVAKISFLWRMKVLKHGNSVE